MSLLRDYSRQARTYDETRAASPSVLGPLREALRGAPGPRLVDVGGGTGNYSLALRADGWEPLVVDRQPEMLARAAAKGLETLEADAQRLPLPDASADAVMLVSMLHHVEDPAAALAEAQRILRPQGRLALMVFTREDVADTWLEQLLPEHARVDGRVASHARRTTGSPARRPPHPRHLHRPRGRLAGSARRPPREARRPPLAAPDELLRAARAGAAGRAPGRPRAPPLRSRRRPRAEKARPRDRAGLPSSPSPRART